MFWLILIWSLLRAALKLQFILLGLSLNPSTYKTQTHNNYSWNQYFFWMWREKYAHSSCAWDPIWKKADFSTPPCIPSHITTNWMIFEWYPHYHYFWVLKTSYFMADKNRSYSSTGWLFWANCHHESTSILLFWWVFWNYRFNRKIIWPFIRPICSFWSLFHWSLIWSKAYLARTALIT